MAQNLAPLPQPGLPIFPGFTATKSETFLVQERSLWFRPSSYLVSYASSAGEPVTPFLEIQEHRRKHKHKPVSFKTMQGEEVMRVLDTEQSTWHFIRHYHGMRSDGNELWYLQLKSGWVRMKYELKISDPAAASTSVVVQRKAHDRNKGILVNGQPGATMSRHERWKRFYRSRHDIVNVAPGMDILLALGVNWVRTDMQKPNGNTGPHAAPSC